MNDRHIAAIEATNTALKAMEDRAIARLEAILEQSYRQLEKKLIAELPKFSSTALPNLLPAQRNLLLMDQLKELLPLLNPQAGEAIRRDFEALLTASTTQGADLAAELVRLSNDTVALTAEIPVEAVAIAAQQSYSRLQKHGQEFAEKATAAIGMGLAQGWGSQKIARALRSQLGVTKGRAIAIARTESMSAVNRATLQTYADNDYTHFQWVATSDDRGCVTCIGRNMKVYRIKDAMIPAHVNCRCYPMIWDESFETDDEFATKFREEAIANLPDGIEPNDGLSPFEKAAGLKKPPKPVWEPGQEKPKPQLTAAQQVLRFEDEKRLQDYETALILDRSGNVLLQKDGSENEIDYTPDELKLMKGAIVTHNHPPLNSLDRLGVGLSDADIEFAVWHQLTEMRAVSAGYRYSLKPGQAQWDKDYWQNVAKPAYDVHYEEVWQEVRDTRSARKAEGKTDEEIYVEDNQYYWHEVTRRTALELGWEYKRTKWKSQTN